MKKGFTEFSTRIHRISDFFSLFSPIHGEYQAQITEILLIQGYIDTKQ